MTDEKPPRKPGKPKLTIVHSVAEPDDSWKATVRGKLKTVGPAGELVPRKPRRVRLKDGAPVKDGAAASDQEAAFEILAELVGEKPAANPAEATPGALDSTGAPPAKGAPPGKASPPAKAGPRPRRRHSGTARFHMSRKAVSLPLIAVHKMTDREALEFLVRVRFGGWESVRCPHCGTTHRHYWRPKDRRWTCAGCGSAFSITSGTVFAHRKLPLQKIIAGSLRWVNSAAGQPALELKRHTDTTYNAVFVHQHKLREALVRGYNVGLVSGDIEMDGAYQSGYNATAKRGVPQVIPPEEDEETVAAEREAILTTSGKVTDRRKRKAKAGGIRNPEYGSSRSTDLRVLLTVVKRSGVRGRGGVGTRVAIGLTEDSKVAQAVLDSYVAKPESVLNTDAAPAYVAPGKGFRQHRTVEHSKTLSGADGEHSNFVEELNWRFDRAEKGVYLNIEPKYLLDYASETSFRSDTRRLPNGEQLEALLHVALTVGTSIYWVGFTHGRHRTDELLHPAPQPAPPSGPGKGRNPLSSANGRPPRKGRARRAFARRALPSPTSEGGWRWSA